MSPEQQVADQLYKSHFGKMVRAMLQFSGDITLEIAEDLVQDAFYTALITWKNSGIPGNPAGWMYTVCRNNAINLLKRNKTFVNPFEEDHAVQWPTEQDGNIFEDQKIRLLFACAHPKLSIKMQLVITLKYVANLRTESIAKALGMTIDGIDKLLARAKQRIRMETVFLAELTPRQFNMRLTVVHQIIYLIFNEGYRAASGKEMVQEALCEESLILLKSVVDSTIRNQDTLALYALLLFHAARLEARSAPDGTLTDLEMQDRHLWNRDLIALGNYYLDQSESEKVSSYHLEAAIAYLHCNATSVADTDWAAIVRLYQHLLQHGPNPFIELNYGIALYYAGEIQRAFELLHNLEHTFLEKSYLLHASLGKLYLQEKQYDKSDQHFRKAYSFSRFQAEKDFIAKLL